MSIIQFIDYLTSEKKYSPHTVRAYQDDLKSFKLFCQKTYNSDKLTEINYGQVRSWIVEMVNQKKSNRTINRKITSLKTYYKYLVKTKQIKETPLLSHQALKVSKKMQVPFSQAEVEEVLDNLNFDDIDFEGIRNKLIVELLYSTGMRRAELIELKLSDVNLHNATLKVIGKRNKERYVPLLNSVQQTLTDYLSERKQLDYTGNYLFITNKGNKIYPNLVYRIINEYFGQVSSKVKKSPHVIRHSFATHLLNEGADLNSVKELLGHSSLASTQIYTHSSLNELKKVYNQAHPRSSKT
ncbi:tyrosine-type recombinase/integrase [Aureibaculum sp. 2210JD6-5]|uniref:tyrosine-type recombinase/integrase n=1 Tax=Aureibaculum sp. 2210JD6-5 TaxID=3103957 RepID=UPI002AAED780|nr:tyrosine-type recombinase/integrase [Aureibaculum sp. 2210JD6-5]MDY7393956.1 tyrosine-type recombinase/integrase [Aureibaculum sp. 2210JD6-5]